MATVPVPRTWTVGELLTASKMNTDLRNGLNFLLSGKPLAVITRSTSQTANPGVYMSWNAEIIDRDGGHDNSTNPTRYTAQTAGWYTVVATLMWINTAGGSRKLTLVRSGATQDWEFRPSAGAGVQSANGLTMMLFCSVGDYIEVEAFQDTGSSLTVTGRLSLEWISTA